MLSEVLPDSRQLVTPSCVQKNQLSAKLERLKLEAGQHIFGSLTICYLFQ